MYKKILFACDLTTESMVLGRKAVELTELFQAELYLLHVVEPPIMYTHNFSDMEKMMSELKSQADIIFKKIRDYLKVPKEKALLLMGTPAAQVIEQAQKLQIDLIMVGSKGVGGYTHLLGSTAQSILVESRKDVLTLSTDHIDPETLKNESMYYARKATIGGNYQQEGLSHGKKNKKLKEIATPSGLWSRLWGSVKGIKQATKRGPKPTLRMPGTPYGPIDREDEQDTKDED